MLPELSDLGIHSPSREPSVKVLLPVTRHAALRTWRRLIDRVVQRRGDLGPLIELIVGVVVEPVLARLVRANPRMALLPGVPTRMLGR